VIEFLQQWWYALIGVVVFLITVSAYFFQNGWSGPVFEVIADAVMISCIAIALALLWLPLSLLFLVGISLGDE
jgi:hypothetical protein